MDTWQEDAGEGGVLGLDGADVDAERVEGDLEHLAHQVARLHQQHLRSHNIVCHTDFILSHRFVRHCCARHCYTGEKIRV